MARIRRLKQHELEKWSKAIHRACEDGWVPALRSAFSHLMPFVDEKCETAFTDCMYRVGLSPKAFDDSVSIDQLACIMIHETLHNVQHHAQRAEKKEINQLLWNYATDLEINSIIAEGIFGIRLTDKPSPSNGHWDRLYGKYWRLENDDEVKHANAPYMDSGKTPYHIGDWFYEGCLLPGTDMFNDFSPNLTAEQYLEMLEADEETVPLSSLFLGNLGKQEDNKNDNNNDNESGSSSNASNTSSDDVQDNNNDGSFDNEVTTVFSSNTNNDGTDGDISNSGTSSNNISNVSDAGSGDVTESNSSSNGTGSSMNEDDEELEGDTTTLDDGSVVRSIGDSKATVTRIYKKNRDGSRTQVSAPYIDRIDIDKNSEIWKKASELGINPITRGEEQKVREQLSHDIENERRGDAYGTAPGNMLLSYVNKGLRRPVTDWKKVLRHVASNACAQQTKGHDDYTYRRISRRYSRDKFISPGMTAYVPTIRFALDTSGSMSAEEYMKALSEAQGVLKLIRAKLQTVCCDTVTSEVKEIKTISEFTDELVGGGGTDMGSVIDQIIEQKKRERPDVVIIATDGCWDWDSFAERLSAPEMKKVVPIVLLVYKFDVDSYYSKQDDINGYDMLLKKYHKKARVIQAWS